MLHGVNFELQTMPGKMDMNLNHMSNQATVAFLLTSAMLHEVMMMTKFVHFSYMTGTLVPCIRCLHPRKVDVGSTTFALSFAGSYFGLVMKQFHSNAIRSPLCWLCWRL